MHYLNPFTNPNVFMWICTGLFAANAISNAFVSKDFRMVMYCVGAVVLQLSVLSMAAKS